MDNVERLIDFSVSENLVAEVVKSKSEVWRGVFIFLPSSIIFVAAMKDCVIRLNKTSGAAVAERAMDLDIL